jgi:hypothetical protein
MWRNPLRRAIKLRDFGGDDVFVEGLKRVGTRCAAYLVLRVYERCQMMKIYVIVFFLLPFVGMISALVVLGRERRVRSQQRHSGLR